MSLGTIHPNLYKTIAEEGRTPVVVKSNLKISLFILSFLVVSSFMVSAALATYESQMSITDSVDRINRSGTSRSVTWQINVTNQPGSANTIRMVNITNATGYVITGWNATDNSTDACTRYQLSLNCTGLNILAGGQLRINVTTTQPAVSGERTWTVHTQDSDNVVAATSLYTAAIEGVDLAFDIYDELGNVTNESFVQLYNGTSVLFVANNVFRDTDNNGLILIESGNVSAQVADTVQFNVTRKGFVDRNQTTTRSDTTTTSYDPNSDNVAWNNGFRPTGSLFRMKITVTDELGNIVSDATVNVTDLPLTETASGEGGITQQSTTTANHSSNGVFYFALRDSFSNVTFQVTRAGFLDNATINNDTSTTFLANRSAQEDGNSTYRLNFRLRVNVTDELQAGAVFASGMSFLINNTVATANQSSSNIYYFSIGQLNGVNVSSSRSGYVNTSNNEVALNSTLQARVNPQMPFRLRLVVIDELGEGAVFQDTTNTVIALNNTTSTANSTSTNNYYFNLTQSAVNVSVAKSGYINTTNATLNNNPLNTSTQALLVAHLNFSIRVTDLCSELGQPGECFAMDGALASVQYSGSAGNTTYSGSDAYINVSTGVSTQQFIINASRTGFVNATRTITTNQSTQARVVFNATDQTATATDRVDGLLFSIKVLGVFDELGLRNFTLNNTASWGQSQAAPAGAGADIVTQANNVFYVGPSAYVNATGSAAVELAAFIGNQTMANRTVGVTPNAVSQQTVIFNHTDQLSANVDVGGLRYILNVTLADELSNATNFDSGVTIYVNNSAATADKNTSSGTGRSYYLTNTSQVGVLPTQVYLNITRSGYINVSADNLEVNATNGTSSSLTMNFNLKVAVNDELSNAFTASLISFRANNSAVSQANSTSGVFAYFALPPFTGTAGGYLINASRVGYVDNATSDTTLILVNSSAQALRNVTVLFNVKVPVRGLCDELNVTCLTIDGSTSTAGSGGISESGTGITNSTTYSGGIAYINVTNGSAVTLVAFGDGYVNRTATATPNANNQTFVVFNVSNTTVEGVSAFRYVNASPMLFTVRVTSVCDELNFTCFSLTGSGNGIAAGGVSLSGNTTSYSGGIAYIPVEGTSAVNLVGFSRGYVNATQSVTPTPGTGQVTAAFNASIFGLNYTVRVVARDQLGDSTNMGSGIRIATNRTPATMGDLVENISFFRNRNANMYFINASIDTVNSTGGVNVTLMRDGYINVTSANLPINSSSTANVSLNMNFAALIRTRTQNSVSFTGATVQLIDAGGNTFTVDDGNGTVTALYNTTNLVANGTGSFGDNSTQNDGLIYWVLNQSNVTNTAEVLVLPNRNGYQLWRSIGRSLSYDSQLSVTSANVVDGTAPAAATSVTSTVSGKQVSTIWTASTSNDVEYYRVYRNATLLGTSGTTTFTDQPTLGDTTAPGAASSVTATRSGTEITVLWTAPASSIYVYNISTVDKAGNAASSNGTSGGASVSPVASYRVFRNDTLLGTSTTTSFKDNPGIAGVYQYNVTTVSDANVLASSNGTSGTVDTRDTTAPAAATSVTATVSGKEVQVTWAVSTSSDTTYYRVFRNATLVGTSYNSTAFTDNPTSGDTTAPGAATSVSAARQGTSSEIQVVWVAPANSIFVYNITSVDSVGNLASSNGTSGGASVSPVANYRVYRNDTLVGTASSTGISDNPGVAGIYAYNITTVSDANVLSSSNGTATAVNLFDTTAPAAATSVTATVSGKEAQVTWTASTSIDVGHYRVYRNATYIGATPNTTVFVNNPTLGDTTAPGAASSVTTSQLNGTITVSWVAPANSIYVYNVTTVDTTGNSASSNGTSGGASVSPVSYYRVYRNDTLVGTSSTTSFTDAPPRGVFIYNVTTVSDAAVLASTNGTATSIDTKDSTAPAAATSVTASVTGKEASIIWTGSTSSDVSYYRVYRNATLLGTSSTTTATDQPTFGDTTAPGAATSVTAGASGGQVNISWIAPANSIYVYNITTVDTGGNLASSNGTSGGASVNPVSYYRVYRNATLLGTSSTTAFIDSPTAGIYVYNVTTVSDTGTQASSNGTATAIDTRDSTAPAAATSVTATVSGKEAQVTWTASTASDVSYYRIYRNNTLLGTSTTTAFTDNPAIGDTTAPGAPTSVSAARQGTSSEIQVVWIAPSNSIYVYNVTTVDTSGNLASSNGTSGAASINTVANYRVYRNDTLVGTASSTGISDNPGVAGIYAYNITTVSDANVASSSNGTATAVNLFDTTAPAAATSVTATVSGKEAQLLWTASTSIDIGHYRVYRNATYIGATPNTTSFTDNPVLGDTTAPGAPSSVTATVTANNATYREVSISWTAPSASIFVYNISAVDTTGNLASSNGTSGGASVSPVAYYRIYRNNTLLGTSTTTAFVDNPTAGIFVYNVTTISDAAVLSSSNGTSGGATIAEIVAPTITLTSPAAGANVTTQTPTISFRVEDNAGGIGVDVNSIAVNISGFSPALDCTTKNDLNYTCTYVASSLTDATNHTISIAARDKFGNAATNATRNFGVLSSAGVVAALNTSDTSAIADNTYANGWSFTFNVTLGSTTSNITTVNATAVRIGNWSRVGGTETIPTSGNTVMNYTISNGTAATYYVSHNYNATDTIYPLQDGDSGRSVPINGTVTIYIKIPAATVPGSYTTTFTFGSWIIALTGGNPS